MNDGTSRREFLGTLAAFSLFPLEQEKPELILYNGNILTVNDREPRAQAVAIARGRFLAVGSDSDLLQPGEQANIVAHSMNARRNICQARNDLRIDLARIGLAGHGE